MQTKHSNNRPPERRSEPRTAAPRYYSVQFTTRGLKTFYQFKLWNISQKGMCILVKEGSEVIKHLAVGDILEMIYHSADVRGEFNRLKTQIKHITPNSGGRFGGHCLVGLAIL